MIFIKNLLQQSFQQQVTYTCSPFEEEVVGLWLAFIQQNVSDRGRAMWSRASFEDMQTIGHIELHIYEAHT